MLINVCYKNTRLLSCNTLNIIRCCHNKSERFDSQQDPTLKPPKELHPLLWLAGTWKSIKADGFYPTIDSFSYREVLNFETAGHLPLLKYESNTWNPKDGKPIHLERGFLRVEPGSNRVAFMIGYGLGYTILEEGVIEENILKTKSTQVHGMSFVRDPKVLAVAREYTFCENEQLVYRSFMQTLKTPLTEHIKVVYEKCP